VRNLREDEMKAALALLSAGIFALLSILAVELVGIRRSLRRIEHDERQLVVIEEDANAVHRSPVSAAPGSKQDRPASQATPPASKGTSRR